MKTLYFDAFNGAAGDMIIGALLDAGLPLDELRRALGSLGVDGWEIAADRVMKVGIAATKFRVMEHAAKTIEASATAPTSTPPAHRHYHLAGIHKKIDQSALSATGKARASALFQRLAEAEAAIHNMPVEKVHLHEVGALDSIIDIVGCVFAFEWFAADRVVVSPLNVGGGMVHTAHGHYPVPAPATLRLLGDAPVYGGAIRSELLTPTGALVLTAMATSFGPLPPMTVERVGYGAGDRDLPGTPNVLRVIVGHEVPTITGERVVVIECEIDDMNPQIFGHLMDRLYGAGALEVFYASVQMKKNRPGTSLTVIALPSDRERLIDLVFAESTTIGVRVTDTARECLRRESVPVTTALGPVRFKVARRDGRVVNAQPEFDDLQRLAREHNRAVKDVQALAARAWLER